MTRILLVAAFSGAGIYCIVRCLHANHSVRERLADAGDTLMCAVMVPMVAAGATGDRWGVLLTVFAVASAWYVVQSVAAHSSGAALIAHGGHLGDLLPQAVMMAAMCWMLLPANGSVHASMHGMAMARSGAVTIALVVSLGASAVWLTALSVRAAAAGRSALGFAGVTACRALMALAMATTLWTMLR